MNQNITYLLASKQQLGLNQMRVTSGNVANGAVGGKRDIHVFHRLTQNNTSFPNDVTTVVDLSPGPIKPTGRNLDVAVIGREAFIPVMTQNGIMYTKNGSFIVQNNTLCTASGDQVLGADLGENVFAANDDLAKVAIYKNGEINIDGFARGQIGLVTFESPSLIRKAGENYFTTDQEPIPDETAVLVQGSLEESNHNPISETTKLMEAQRGIMESQNLLVSNLNLYTKMYGRLSNGGQ